MNESTADVRALVEQIAKAIVDEPEQVSVERSDGETTVFELTVAPDDVGKVIGRQGRVARAFRCLVSATGARARQRYEFEILE